MVGSRKTAHNDRIRAFICLLFLIQSSFLLIEPSNVKGLSVTFSGGSGTEEDPYLIASVWDLQNVSYTYGKSFILSNDIDATITKEWNSGEGFYSIGSGYIIQVPWYGHFDGKNHTIKGLFMRQPTWDGIGLFGLTYYATIIKNLNLSISITGDEFVGGLVGETSSQTIIDNVHVQGYVRGTWMTGGLVGLNHGLISNSSFSGNVRGKDECGGLVGNNGNKIDFCRTEGDLIGNSILGGLVGIGYGGSISNSISCMNISGQKVVGGLIGSFSSFDSIINSHYSFDKIWINGCHQLTVGGLFETQYTEWIEDLSLNISDYDQTIVPNGDHFEISISQGLSDLLGFYYYENNKYELSSDIDLNGMKNMFLPYFIFDSFDGNDHKIKNLKIDQQLGNPIGLFGHSQGNIRNVCLENFSINGSGGGLCGVHYGDVDNCHVNGTIRNCSGTGGLSGNNYGNVSNCSSKCLIDGSNTIGGLIGSNKWGKITSSWSVSDITGKDDIGGLIGRHGEWGYNSLIDRCYSNSRIRGHDHIGGLVGWNFGRIDNSYADGVLDGREAGGLVGENSGEIFNCYAWTEVEGFDYSGGMVGYNRGIIADCYAKGFVRSSGTRGGLVGLNGSNDITGFWDVQTSGCTSSHGGIGKRTVEMMTKTTFTDAGWDFDDIWCIGDGNSYPMFRWQDHSRPSAEPGKNLITYEDTIFTFDGSECWDDIGISNYTWTCMNPHFSLFGIAPTYIFEDPGTYECHLIVMDPVGKLDQIYFNVTVIDNTDPIADAGEDIIGYEDREVSMFAGLSSDNDGIVNFTWAIDEWNETTTLFGQSVTYVFNEPGEYSAVLKVTDHVGLWDIDSMGITILDDTNPIARAGDDLVVNEDTPVIFDASDSKDNVLIVNWTWTIYDNTGHTDIFGPIQQYIYANPGDYHVGLKVADERGLVGYDELIVHVVDITRPIADAGDNLTVDEDTVVILNGSWSYDNGPITNYTWSIYDHTDPIWLFGPVVKYLFHTPGKYDIWLGVIDASGMSGFDHIFVEVIDTTPPVAEAGPDITVDQEEILYFNGSMSSDNVRVVFYIWTFNDGSMQMKLYGINPVYKFRNPGMYIVRLNVSDGRMMSDDDFMTVTVTDTEAPVAYAGEDINIELGERMILNAEGCSDNVDIVNYSWAFSVGMDRIVLFGNVTGYRFDEAGTFEVLLTVTDAAGNRASDTVTITVSDDVSYLWPLIITAIVFITVAIATSIIILRNKEDNIEE